MKEYERNPKSIFRLKSNLEEIGRGTFRKISRISKRIIVKKSFMVLNKTSNNTSNEFHAQFLK